MDYSADTDANRDDNVDIFEGLVFFIGREVRMAKNEKSREEKGTTAMATDSRPFSAPPASSSSGASDHLRACNLEPRW